MADHITETDVKESLPPTLRRRAEADDPNVFVDSARKARVWVRSRHRSAAQHPPDWNDDLVWEAAIEYAKYALHAARENEEVAADKKENAREFLSPVLGETDELGASLEPGGSASSGEKPGWMAGFEGRQDPERNGTRRVP